MKFTRWYRRFAIEGPEKGIEALLFTLLLPASLVYGWVGRARVWFFRKGWLRSYRPPVPVVSVGNLATGGTGKTPMVAWLLDWAQRKGVRAAVISRGYGGRRHDGVLTVCAGNGPLVSATEAGDEPWLLASRHPQAVVVVGSDRVGCAECAVREHGAELLLIDDGFQHLRLQRDLDLLLLDARRPFANGRVLPAGYLREPASARQRADLVILTRWHPGVKLPATLDDAVRARHCLGDRLRGLNGELVPRDAPQGRAAAFCGIADPESFFNQLRDMGFRLEATLVFADHCDYSPAMIDQVAGLAENIDFFLTTEKDGVKLADTDLPRPCYQVPLRMEFVSGQDRLEGMLEGLLNKDGQAMPLSKDLLEILACPQCKGEVHCNEDQTAILCDHCRLSFPVRDDIPVMLIDEAQSLPGGSAPGE
ncbi:tetraacyldisaccharide 4'-kinase [Geothermobacter hydrogeniphilus]|uniref:Multifunctional fusion protein n=1 Tax=Geothermobacter hydrogeniphilus TaxID=1969733 RepID=A0A1X0Y1S6_9BACT|nr:tetraacyldisaccharide 4'-kinase [Geothermobacter hydrogeniphilus]ORJ59047.1 tetraacyldisaccharide 4'-kinase [Geothermobacter hydrogeniphilus]